MSDGWREEPPATNSYWAGKNRMLRIPAQGDAFLFSEAPAAANGRVEATLLSCLSGGPLPDLVYWDGDFGDALQGRALFGQGGLDPLLASRYDLTNCVAIREGALHGLVEGTSREALARAIELLARSPAVSSLWCPGLSGSLPGVPAAASPVRRAAPDLLSIALLVSEVGIPVEPFFAALAHQDIDARIEVIVAACDMDSRAIKTFAALLEQCAASDARLKVRRYNLSGQVSPAYLANVAIALSTGETVVVADPRCAPVSPGLIHVLSSWAAGAEIATVCPKIECGGTLFAGLSLSGEQGESATLLQPDNGSALSDGMRLTAAPTPWLFAVRRKAWLASGGLLETGNRLWTAPLAGGAGPRGKHLMIGSEQAQWVGDVSVLEGLESVEVTAPVRKASLMAVRTGRPSPAPVHQMSIMQRGGAASMVRDARAPAVVKPSLADPSPSKARTRVLVFADAFGPSQAIPFQHGLASARDRGEVAVCLVEEAAFAKGCDPVQAQVGQLFAEFRPTVAVVSRLGSQPIWKAVRDEARRVGARLVFHIDDDLLDPPIALGVERYRLARHPRRLHTLHESLSHCDVTLAASPALARRLEQLAGHRRIITMAIGSGGAPPSMRPTARGSDRIVIGYMGSASHNHDLAMIAPALNRIMESCANVDVSLFGSIARQPAAKMLKGRIVVHPGIFGDYAAFRKRLAEIQFDIGIAPLRDLPFNRCKTPTKWVEYAEAGIPCVASDVEPYHPILEAGAAIGARPDQWEAALRRLVDDASLREDMVRQADRLLRSQFGWERLENSMVSAIGHDELRETVR